MDKRPTLFYSWQSDHSRTRSYIEAALKKALESVASTMKIEDALRFDKDTQGEVGAVSITSTIKKKINGCKIFVADVSLVDNGKSDRKLVNQNVMFELGYAFGKKTEKAVMLIANKDLGDASELPFDIAHNRIIFCSPKTDPKADRLVPVLEYAIRAHLGFLEEELKVDEQAESKDLLIAAIENNKPTISKAETFFQKLYDRYLAVAPGRYDGSDAIGYGEKIADAYQKSLSITIELYDVVSIAAEYKEANTITCAYRMLGLLSAMYDNQPGESGKYESSDEYYALVINEIASIVFGLLAKFSRWQTIGELIPREFIKPRNGYQKYTIGSTYKQTRCITQYYKMKTNTDYAIPTTPLIQERFVDNDKILQAYASGALIIFLALKWYYPYIIGLFLTADHAYIPEFVHKLRSKTFADNFKAALSLSSVEQLRRRIDEKRQIQLADIMTYRYIDLTHIFQDEGLIPVDLIGAA